jgi:hypothetical protein
MELRRHRGSEAAPEVEKKTALEVINEYQMM